MGLLDLIFHFDELDGLDLLIFPRIEGTDLSQTFLEIFEGLLIFDDLVLDKGEFTLKLGK
jgi:hypothetical protein